MKINGVDISNRYDGKVKFWRFRAGKYELKNESEWKRGAAIPMFGMATRGVREFEVTLMVYGSGRDDIEMRANRVVADLMQNTVEIKVDGRRNSLCGVMGKAELKGYSEQSREKFQALEMVFEGYEHGDEISYAFSNISAAEVENPGTAIAPARIELTPSVGMAKIELTGICRNSENTEDMPVIVRNLTAGKTIVMDGIHGLITEDGSNKTNDIDIWALPSMRPGVNTVTFGTSYVDVKIKILPIYV